MRSWTRCCIRLLRYSERTLDIIFNAYQTEKKNKNCHLMCPTPISWEKKLRRRFGIASVVSLNNLYLYNIQSNFLVAVRTRARRVLKSYAVMTYATTSNGKKGNKTQTQKKIEKTTRLEKFLTEHVRSELMGVGRFILSAKSAGRGIANRKFLIGGRSCNDKTLLNQ